jgi:hypothetical protein
MTRCDLRAACPCRTQVMDLHGIAAVNSIIFLTVTTPTFLGTVFVQDLISEREVYTREFHGAVGCACGRAGGRKC